MKKIVFLFFILLFSFCTKKEGQYPRLIVPDVDDVVEVNTKQMLNNKPPLLAVNFINDTAVINKALTDKERSIVNFPLDTILPKYNLKITIDTSYSFYSKGFEYKNLPWPKPNDSINKLYPNAIDRENAYFNPYFKKADRIKKEYVASFPVLIFNKSDKKAFISETFDIGDFLLIQEAKDIDGKWKPIEFQRSLMFGCDIAINLNYLLKPKHYIATAIIKYKGNFKTKIRVKMYSGNDYYYSNEIVGYINRSQFSQDFIKAYFKERTVNYEEKDLGMYKDFMFLNFEKYFPKK